MNHDSKMVRLSWGIEFFGFRFQMSQQVGAEFCADFPKQLRIVRNFKTIRDLVPDDDPAEQWETACEMRKNLRSRSKTGSVLRTTRAWRCGDPFRTMKSRSVFVIPNRES